MPYNKADLESALLFPDATRVLGVVAGESAGARPVSE
jgi:hypothetical protein